MPAPADCLSLPRSRIWKCLPVLLLAGSAYASPDVPPAGTPVSAVPPPAALVPEKNLCSTRAEAVAVGSVQWNGWGRDFENTRYQPEPAIRATDVPNLALKWAYGYQSGTEFGQPTMVDGR